MRTASVRELRIRHLDSRYRLPADLDQPTAIARAWDDVAAGQMPQALSARLSTLYAQAGLAEDAEVAVRRVALRIRTRSTQIPAGTLAAAWADAIVEAIKSLLGRRDSSGAEENAVVFPNRMAAEIGFLVRCSRGMQPPWWCVPILGRSDVLPRPEDIVVRWIDEVPERAAAALVSVALAAHHGVGELFADPLAAALIRRWLRRLAVRRAEICGGGQDTRATPHSDPSLLSAAMASRVRFAIARTRNSGGRRLLSLAAVLAMEPAVRFHGVEEIDSLVTQIVRMAHADAPPRVDRLGQVGSTSEGDASAPAEGDVSPRRRGDSHENALLGLTGQPEGTIPEGTIKVETEAERRDARARRKGEVMDEATGRGTRARVSSDEDRADSYAISASPDFSEVGCAGLLFLLRPLLRLPMAGEWRGPDLHDRFLLFGGLVLDRLLAKRSIAERKAAINRERPLLEIFAGLNRLPEDFDELPRNGAAQEDAVTALSLVEPMIPSEVELSTAAARFVCGGTELLTNDPDLRRLAAVVLRRARVESSRDRAVIYLPLESVDTAIRRLGWDIDPGWVPDLGRIIRFCYGAS